MEPLSHSSRIQVEVSERDAEHKALHIPVVKDLQFVIFNLIMPRMKLSKDEWQESDHKHKHNKEKDQ
ncbi:hypothetical protein KTT_13940 [Tengunoibacter tsumagoiensis]|uniref:Uncharacterized protein n=1 Tax=Tengunoibacter tsumagoiensis TaxID=2014871 RepID=A0A401ZXH2_9CHLR|nr:hypothetical protein KTT_13940 [Tengunoibacter tsumagoiensis]